MPTVMVVDDDPGIQQAVTAILEDEGYQVTVARNGAEAVEMLEQERPALVLLDLMLPRMSGQEVMRELERRGIRRDMPIIVLTADARAHQKAADIGADGFLEKPFSLTGLLNLVAEKLGNTPS